MRLGSPRWTRPGHAIGRRFAQARPPASEPPAPGSESVLAGHWLTIGEVAARAQVSVRTVQRLMETTRRAGLTAVWIKLGRMVRFQAGRVDPWLIEVSAWQASKSGEASSGSAGGPTPVGSERAPVPRASAPRKSPSTSNTQRPSAVTGSLKELARRLISPT